jgi:hypothetical protein
LLFFSFSFSSHSSSPPRFSNHSLSLLSSTANSVGVPSAHFLLFHNFPNIYPLLFWGSAILIPWQNGSFSTLTVKL